MTPALEVRDLVVRRGALQAVRGVSFTLNPGERIGIVGESGAGKSLTALAIMGLLPVGWKTSGTVMHDGVDLLAQSDRDLARRRGRTISMVFQDPMSALNPAKRVGAQVSSVIRRHTGVSTDAARRQTMKLLADMRLPRPVSLMRAYPHALSGGQRQRVMIAMALACYPTVIIADEPTTALDVTVQKQVLSLMHAAVAERGCALVMITHDLPVIATMCERVGVMYAGRMVEMGATSRVFRSPRHHYTRGLLDSQPTMDNVVFDASTRLPSIPGIMPALTNIPSGCAFRTRCSAASAVCSSKIPELEDGVACWHPITTGAVSLPRSETGARGE